MASVTWDNFHKILSTEMNSLLENEDFVDVTLAVEGRHLKAHKMVLSMCSPYFKELFKSTPCKHPIVFLKDVSYNVLRDLLQFMYIGQVQVSNENFNTFMKTAESLQIRGLSNNGNDVPTECGSKSQHDEVALKESQVRKSRKEMPQASSTPKQLRLSEHIPIVETVKSEPSTEEGITLEIEPYTEEGLSRFIANEESAKSAKSLLFKRLSNLGNNSTVCNNETLNSMETEVQRSDETLRRSSTLEFSEHSTMDDDVTILKTDEEQSANFSDDPLALADDTNEDNYWMDAECDESVGTNVKADLKQEMQEKLLLPEKSKGIYMKVYAEYKDWCLKNEVRETSEEALLIYFKEQAVKKKASTLWAAYSMLKSTILLKENIDITKYFKLMAFIKCKNASYKPKRSSVFSKEEITKFLTEAPDDYYLSTKAIFIIGIAGACRTDELVNMHLQDIKVQEDLIIVNIPNKDETSRKFVIMEPLWIEILTKYLTRRPTPDMPKVFISFRNGKPTRQNIGHNTISATPNKVAKFLNLPQPELYTGHSLRRTSAAISAKKGGITEVVQGMTDQADFNKYYMVSIPSTSRKFDTFEY